MRVFRFGSLWPRYAGYYLYGEIKEIRSERKCCVDIQYTKELPTGDDLFELFHSIGWNRSNHSPVQLLQMQQQSWSGIYAYDGGRLIGTGRVTSDGMATGFLSGLGVHPEYRGRGIGTQMVRLLLQKCEAEGISVELFCAEDMVPFYSRFGFECFAVGMKKTPNAG